MDLEQIQKRRPWQFCTFSSQLISFLIFPPFPLLVTYIIIQSLGSPMSDRIMTVLEEKSASSRVEYVCHKWTSKLLRLCAFIFGGRVLAHLYLYKGYLSGISVKMLVLRCECSNIYVGYMQGEREKGECVCVYSCVNADQSKEIDGVGNLPIITQLQIHSYLPAGFLLGSLTEGIRKRQEEGKREFLLPVCCFCQHYSQQQHFIPALLVIYKLQPLSGTPGSGHISLLLRCQHQPGNLPSQESEPQSHDSSPSFQILITPSFFLFPPPVGVVAVSCTYLCVTPLISFCSVIPPTLV